MTEVNFVNIHGETVSLERLAADKPKRPKKAQPESYHNGWRAQGIPPGALEEARKTAAAQASYERMQGKQPKEWDEQHWLVNAKRKPVRSKPYEVPQAAYECKALAEKAGWLRVEVVELKRDASA